MRLSTPFLALLGAFLERSPVTAWAPNNRLPSLSNVRTTDLVSSVVYPTQELFHRDVKLGMADASENASSSESGLSDEEWNTIVDLCEKASSGEASLEQVILEALPTINPALIMKLRGAVQDSREEFQAVSNALNSCLDARMAEARDILEELLNAGEIRKLDAIIGKAAREDKLDVAFFQVLNVNLQDAAKDKPVETDPEGKAANRFQILQHIYTRCQEEVEKTLPGGVALLNKLLRTEVTSIRANQYNHYLCPQPNVIKTPDGKELELQGREKILVAHDDFIDAIANAIKQIRTVEKAGGADRAMAANMVESVRAVATEARVAIGEHFGRESEELKNFEEGLQPVFRPTTEESPYIKGV